MRGSSNWGLATTPPRQIAPGPPRPARLRRGPGLAPCPGRSFDAALDVGLSDHV